MLSSLFSSCQTEVAGDRSRCGRLHGLWPESDWAHAESKTWIMSHTKIIFYKHRATDDDDADDDDVLCLRWLLPSSSSSSFTLKVITSFSNFEMMSLWLPMTCCPCPRLVHQIWLINNSLLWCHGGRERSHRCLVVRNRGWWDVKCSWCSVLPALLSSCQSL